MRHLVKWGSIVFIAVGALSVLVVAFGYLFLKQTVPSASGQMQIPGLAQPVEIIRDLNGIPHIKAHSRADAAAALGFAHAQDRMWQMEILRMTGQGRLSEIFGSPTIDIDRFLRSLGFADQVEGSLKILSQKSKRILASYADGVNAFLNRKSSLLRTNLPPEFLILGHSPEAWKPEHSLLVLKIMSLQLSMNMDREIKRLGLTAQGLSTSEIDDIMPYHNEDGPPPMPDVRDFLDLQRLTIKKASLDSGHVASLKRDWVEDIGRWASNNWVVTGSRTDTGKPLLANDPHLSFGAPSLWYLAHVSWPDDAGGQHEVIGATIPALPVQVLGRNNHLAWGFTNAGADVQDVFIEKVKIDDPHQYLTPDGWVPFEIHKEIIKVKNGTDVKFTRRIGRHGPILPLKFRRLDEMLPLNHVAALSWPGLSDQDLSFDVVSELSETKTLEGFSKTVERAISPMQAMVVADFEGNIGLFAPAAVPDRGAKNLMLGRAPVPGWIDSFNWQGMVAIEKLPKIINPLTGALGTANSRFVSRNFDPFITFDWDERFRHDRVQKLFVKPGTKHSVKTMVDGQMDTLSPALIALREVYLDQMAPRPNHTALLLKLHRWNGKMDANLMEPLLMTSFHRHVLEMMFKDELGAVYDTIHTSGANAVLRILRDGGTRDWCDNVNTQATETCSSILGQSFDLAVAELEAAQGENSGAWQWGKAHVVFAGHRPFSGVWPLSLLFDVVRESSGGSYSLMRAKNDFKDKKHPYRAVHGAGYRAVYDFSDLNKSLFVQSTGQSGNPMSPHYDDQIDLWTDGKYIQMSTDPKTYNDEGTRTWKLSPVAEQILN